MQQETTLNTSPSSLSPNAKSARVDDTSSVARDTDTGALLSPLDKKKLWSRRHLQIDATSAPPPTPTTATPVEPVAASSPPSKPMKAEPSAKPHTPIAVSVPAERPVLTRAEMLQKLSALSDE